MRLAAAGTRIGEVDFCATSEGAAHYRDLVGGWSGRSDHCLTSYPFAPTLPGVDLAALGIDFDTAFLASCSFDSRRPLPVGEGVRITVDIADVRSRQSGNGSVGTVVAEFRAGPELIAVHRYVFVDGVAGAGA